MSIAVIDPRQSEPVGSNARALQTLFSSKNTDGQPLVPRAAVLNAPTLDVSCRWLADLKFDKRPTPQHLPDLLKSSVWNALTSDREGHHAMSNVLGAFLLSMQFKRIQTNPIDPKIQDYLLALVRACGIAKKTQQTLAMGDWMSSGVNQGFPTIDRVVLIDDMADLWQEFLIGALRLGDEETGGTRSSAPRSFVATNSATFRQTISSLPGRLSTFLAEKRQWLTVSDLIPGNHQFERDFVLFLDLRLFPNDRSSADSFHQGLVEIGRKILADGNRRLPWLDARRYIELGHELDRDGISGHPPETLLPRILSLLDPTLPIVIFSSTHRAELIEPFREYGNIITTIRKPILSEMTGHWSNIVRELRSDFASSIEQGASILGVRRKLARLTLKTPIATARQPATEKGRIVEIYMDESGDPFNRRDPGFAVGGIMLQHEDESVQSAFHTAINQAPKKWGVSDFSP